LWAGGPVQGLGAALAFALLAVAVLLHEPAPPDVSGSLGLPAPSRSRRE
jgi:hypothetical protein